MNQFFLDDEDCQECDVILESLENIDDEADLYGIDFVKSDDAGTAKRYHIYNTPALVYFRKQNPVTFEADLTDEEAILNWYLLMIFFPLFLLCITLLFTRSDNQFRNYESCIFTKSFCRLNCFVKKDTNTNKQSRVVINWRNFVFMILKLVAGSSEQDV